MPAKVVETLYGAFQNCDGEEMADCYHPQATFSDPVFPDLDSSGVKNMWKMLCRTGLDLSVQYTITSVSGNMVEVTWHARYTFTKTGRRVHNVVRSSLQIQDNKIIRQRDYFGFWKWSRQAFGPAGMLLGWMPVFKNKVRRVAAESLLAFSTSKEMASSR